MGYRLRPRHNQRLLNECCQQVNDRRFLEPSSGTDLLRHFQRPSACKDGEPAEERSLFSGKQIVAPVDRPLQCLVARQRRPAAAGEETEPVTQPFVDLYGCQGAGPCGRQLDRQRDPIELPADTCHCPGIVFR